MRLTQLYIKGSKDANRLEASWSSCAKNLVVSEALTCAFAAAGCAIPSVHVSPRKTYASCFDGNRFWWLFWFFDLRGKPYCNADGGACD